MKTVSKVSGILRQKGCSEGVVSASEKEKDGVGCPETCWFVP